MPETWPGKQQSTFIHRIIPDLKIKLAGTALKLWFTTKGCGDLGRILNLSEHQFLLLHKATLFSQSRNKMGIDF